MAEMNQVIDTLRERIEEGDPSRILDTRDVALAIGVALVDKLKELATSIDRVANRLDEITNLVDEIEEALSGSRQKGPR